MTFEELQIVNYCHRSCSPLKNIMRLPRDEAFAMAQRLAAQNENKTAFYRFADFENYYPERLKTDGCCIVVLSRSAGDPPRSIRCPLSCMEAAIWTNGLTAGS